jgi:hypothetical protein
VTVARGQGDDETRRIADNMSVGDDVATVVKDDARPEGLWCLDLHDRGRDHLDDAYEVLLQQRWAVR